MADYRKILWADDEIELLQPHIIFLGERGYSINGVRSGEDALKAIRQENYDAVLLDEQMAGLDGIATLGRLKKIRPDLPVIMVTKSEEETTMEEAIGGRANDYLTKPVNPSQILLALKKLLEGRSIATQRLSRDWVKEFQRISEELSDDLDWEDWLNLAHRLARWSIEISSMPEAGLEDLLNEQMESANSLFARYIEEMYPKWVDKPVHDRPILSLDIVKENILPRLQKNEPVLFLVLDGLRLDHWYSVEPILRDSFDITNDLYFSCLPTATSYSRNSLFSGLWPKDYPKKHPDLWKKLHQFDEASANRFERQLLDRQLERINHKITPEPKYAKILDPEEAGRVLKKASDFFDQPLVSMVFNFVDIVAHHRSTEEVIQTLIPDEAAYRSVVKSWFEHSPLYDLLHRFGERGVTIILTSDHGSKRVKKAVKVVGDKEASSNLRYKVGRNLQINTKQSIKIKNLEEWGLPLAGINDDYILAKDDNFFVYPNDFNKYADLYKDSFLHGGVSLEEMVVPLAILKYRQ